MNKLFEFDEHIGDWRVLVQSRDIQNGAIQGRHIAPGAVTGDNIADGAIQGRHIAPGAVTGDNIADGAITTPKIADGAVTREKIADGAIDDIYAVFKGLVDNYKPTVINGDVTNAPDEEDLTSVDGLLKLKNRSSVLAEKGYTILRRNHSFADQVSLINTIYEIRYDFDLNGETITIPAGCILKFYGGSLSNGKIIGTDTYIDSPIYKIFNSITFGGSFSNETIHVAWFGAAPEKYDNYTELQSAASFVNAVNSYHTLLFEDGNYYISIGIVFTKPASIYGPSTTITSHDEIQPSPILGDDSRFGIGFYGPYNGTDTDVLSVNEKPTNICINFKTHGKCFRMNDWSNAHVYNCKFSTYSPTRINVWREDVKFWYAIDCARLRSSTFKNLIIDQPTAVKVISPTYDPSQSIDIPVASSADGLRLVGCCHDILVDNVQGVSGDDFIAISPSEGYIAGKCDAYNLTFRNIIIGSQAKLSHGGFRIYSKRQDVSIEIRDVTIDNCKLYTRSTPIYFTNNDGVYANVAYKQVKAKNIKVTNCVFGTSDYREEVWGPGRVHNSSCITCDGTILEDVVVKDCVVKPIDYDGNSKYFIEINQYNTVTSLTIDNIKCYGELAQFMQFNFKPSNIPGNNRSSTIGELVFENITFGFITSAICNIVGCNNCNYIKIIGCDLANKHFLLTSTSAASADVISNLLFKDTVGIATFYLQKNNEITNMRIYGCNDFSISNYENPHTDPDDQTPDNPAIRVHSEKFTNINILSGKCYSTSTYLRVNTPTSKEGLVLNSLVTFVLTNNARVYARVVNRGNVLAYLIEDTEDTEMVYIMDEEDFGATTGASCALVDREIILSSFLNILAPIVRFTNHGKITGNMYQGLQVRSHNTKFEFPHGDTLSDHVNAIAVDSMMYDMGTTEQRTTNCPVGHKYFDTTLGKPIYAKEVTRTDSGTTEDPYVYTVTWVDALGNDPDAEANTD